MFTNEKYFREMNKRLEGTFNVLFKSSIVILGIIVIFRWLFLPNDPFKYIALGLLLGLLAIEALKSKMSNDFRIQLVVGALLLIGLYALYYYGVSGTGIGVLIVANLASSVFGSRKSFIVVSTTSVLGYILVVIVREYILLLPKSELIEYFFQFMIVASAIFLVRVAISGIHKAFLLSIKELDYTIKENELMITDLQEQHDELRDSKIEIYELAYYDKLTGLPNKNNFMNYVNHRLGGTNKATMLLLDIKNFKLLNSVYGSNTGDQLLKLIAELIKEFDDIFYACRVGGNEFVLWYESDDKLFMKSKMDEFILEFNVRLRKFFTYKHVHFRLTYVSYPEDGHSYLELYDHLNIAQKYQKIYQSDDFLKYESFMKEELHAENRLKDLIEDAIQRRSFEVYYQEQIDCITNRVVGLEALARWHSDDLGDVTPDEFIPIIKKYQMVESFERLIIGKVFSDYGNLLKKYGQINISMNISPSHLLLEHFVEYFGDAMMMYRINPKNISLEITEDIIDHGIELMDCRLRELRNHGVRIILDNFGANNSAFNCVARLPLDEIKIDRQFIKDIEQPKMQNILKTLLDMKKILNVRIVAEGVEDEKQLEILKSLGCTEIQGFLFQKPSPLENLTIEPKEGVDIC